MIKTYLKEIFQRLYRRAFLFAAILAAFCLLSVSQISAQAVSDLTVSKTAPGTVQPGANINYTITVTNFGPDAAADATLTDMLPGDTTFVSITQNSGPAFSCTTPATGAGGTVTCTLASFSSGASAQFTLVVNVPGQTAMGMTYTNVATVASSTFDPNDENNAAPATTTIGATAAADLSVTKSAPETVQPGGNINYTIVVTNAGSGAAATNVTLTDTLPGDATFVSLAQNSGPTFSCTTPAVGAGGTVTCTLASLPSATSAQFTLAVNVPSGTPIGTEYTNTATVTSETFDPNEENGSSTTTTTTSALAPTAAYAAVSGRAITARGRAISGATIRLIDEQGRQRLTRTTAFGQFRFINVPAGQTYIISISAKRHTFAERDQTLNLTDETGGIMFVADK